MDVEKIMALLGKITAELDQCADEVPSEISARENLYFRMKDAAMEARLIEKELRAEKAPDA